MPADLHPPLAPSTAGTRNAPGTPDMSVALTKCMSVEEITWVEVQQQHLSYMGVLSGMEGTERWGYLMLAS